MGFFWCFARLPYGVQIRYGRKFGAFVFAKAKKVRHVTKTNVQTCFPHLSTEQINEMALLSCQELGIAIAETMFTWFCNNDKLVKTSVKVTGEEHFQQALLQNRAIILLSCHFGSPDLNAHLISSMERNKRKLIGSFRPINPFVNRFLITKRSGYLDAIIEIKNLRQLAKRLKQGDIVWYAPDMEFQGKGATFANFMGVKASTTTALSRLTKLTDAIVLPIAHYRVNDKPEYQLKIFPALQDFPSKDLVDDTNRMNAAFEQILQPYPDRYWWAIKRFKHRPAGEAEIY